MCASQRARFKEVERDKTKMAARGFLRAGFFSPVRKKLAFIRGLKSSSFLLYSENVKLVGCGLVLENYLKLKCVGQLKLTRWTRGSGHYPLTQLSMASNAHAQT